MKINRRAVALVVAVAVAEALLGLPAAAAPALTVKGDQQAWSEIVAAFAKWSSVKSYRAKMTSPGSGGGEGTLDFENPDRYHLMMGGQFESVQVGRDIRIRMGSSGPWQCTGQPSPAPVTDPRQMSGDVDVARGPAAAIDGVPTRSYTYTWQNRAGATPAGVHLTVKTRLFVANSSGLPKRVQILGDNDQVQQQFDYVYDVPITITLPACG